MSSRPDLKQALATFADLVAIATLLGSLLRAHIPFLSETHLALILSLAALSMLWLLGRLERGRQNVESEWFLGPNWLWRLIYNRVPAFRGKPYSASKSPRILIVSSPSHEVIATSLLARLLGRNVSADVLIVGSSETINPALLLTEELQTADAAYVLWSDSLRDQRGVATALTQWAMDNSHKPLLIANFLTRGEYDLTFPALAGTEVEQGLPLLLTRAIDRARVWRDQAALFRQIAWVGIFMAGVLAVLDWGMWSQFQTARALMVWNEPAFLSLQSSAEGLHADVDSEQEGLSDRGVPTLASAATFVESTLSQWFRIAATDRPQVSMWRRMRVKTPSGSKLVLVQVAWSGERPARVFGDVDTTIIGLAFNNPDLFITWQPKAKKGSWAAWDGSLAQAGEFIASDTLQIFRSHRRGYYGTVSGDDFRRGLVCFAQASRDRHVMSGVTIDLRTSPLTLRTEAVVHFLQLAVAVANTVPDHMLMSQGVRKTFAADSLELIPCSKGAAL